MEKIASSVKSFANCALYFQDDAPGLSFRKILPEKIIRDVDMGYVTARGPTRKLPGVHDFDQIYLVFRGRGYIFLDGRRIRLESPCIAVIPRGTEHSVEVMAGAKLEYVYVNRRHGVIGGGRGRTRK